MNVLPKTRVTAPKSWQAPHSHWLHALQDPWYKSVLSVQHELQMAVHNFFTSRNLKTVMMPVTTGSVSSPMGLGSDSLPVKVDLFGVDTFLADSMQFMLEFGCRLHESGTYYVMPCFRGEATDQYHLPQFYHAEVEIPGSLTDVMELASSMVHSISTSLLQNNAGEIERIAGGLDHVEALVHLNGTFPTIRYDEAAQDLSKNNSGWLQQHDLGFTTITRAGEIELVRRHGKANALWITHFEHASVPFYQAYEEKTGRAMNADLILGTCETVGSGERHATRAQVEGALDQHGVHAEQYQWYLEMRDLTPMQTSGFGMGMERYMMWLLKHDDIRDMTILFRENGLNILP